MIKEKRFKIFKKQKNSEKTWSKNIFKKKTQKQPNKPNK